MSAAESFIEEYGSAAVRSCAGTGLLPSVVIAQAALETGWGKTVQKAANNMFGIKATPKWNGKIISLNTSEYSGGVKKSFAGTGKTYGSYAEAVSSGADTTTLFRAYGSVGESLKDHNRLITESERYKPVLAESTPEGQCDALQKCGYSTSPTYSETLKSIIRQYGLSSYDNKKKVRTIAIAAAIAAVVIAGVLIYITVRKWN